MLKISHLSKSFDKVQAVNDISLEVKQGEIFGFLGPNGAGKTTTISMIAGLLKPDSGTIEVDSMNIQRSPQRIRGIMGVVPQDMAFYEELTARENLRFWGRLQGMSGKDLEQQIQYYLNKIGLKGREDDPLKKYSGGMKRRINLIIGLLHNPRLLLLDEPTIGIDVQTKMSILESIREASQKGTTTVYTTHNLFEAEDLCDRIAIMDQGKILAVGTLEELIQIVGEKDIALIQGEFSTDQAQKIISQEKGIEVITMKHGYLAISLDASKKIPSLMKSFFNLGVSMDDISLKQPNLESVFLKLTGRELRE
ncbi:MAG: ATP-binding cassette domain-containing protein [Candidatus Aminicenantes bacterium]|nr:ATP-binding cassette domain-containing protein [Candidatus Aminicenantes bacterium]